MSADDDWVVKFKFDTKAIADAINKINALKAAMAKLHGGNGGTAKAKSDHKAIEALNAKKQKTEEAAQKKAAKAAEAKRQKAIADNKKLLNSILNSEEKRANAIIAADKKIAENKKKLDEKAKVIADKKAAAEKAAHRRENELKNQRRVAITDEVERRKAWAERKKLARDTAKAKEKAKADAKAIADKKIAAKKREEEAALLHSSRLANRTLSLRQRYDREVASERARSVRASNLAAGLRQRHENSEERMWVGRTGLTDTASHAGRRLDREGVRGIEGSTLRRRVSEVQSNISSATTPAALAAARNEMRALNRETNLAVANQRRHTAEVERGNFVTRSLSRSMGNMARGYLSVFAVAGVANTLYEDAKAMENLSVATLMAAGSTQAADVAFAKIKATAKDTGLALVSVTDMYNKVVISAKDAKLGTAETDTIFKGITTMQVGYAFNEEQQKLVSKAFAQMLGKQAVNAEEFDFRLAS